MRTRRWLMLVLAAAAVLLVLGRVVAGTYADYLWYESLGAAALWRTRITALTTLRLGFAAAAALFAFLNLYAVRQSVVSLVFPRRLGNLEIGEEVPGRSLLAVAIGLSLVIALLLALPEGDWIAFELARSGHVFAELDPYFGADLGFFVYWLPFEAELWSWMFSCVAVVSITVVLLYALTPSLRWQRGTLYVSSYVRRHFTVLIGVFVLLLAWSFRLEMYSLLANGSGAGGAFTYVDHRVGVPGDLLLALVALGAALIVIWAGFVGQFRLAGISVLALVVLALVVREVAPLVVDHSGTDAERAQREQPYLGTRATYSRRAYGVDAIVAADSTMAYPSVNAALPYVSIWDPPALAAAIDPDRAPEDRVSRIAWRALPSALAAEVVDPPPAGAPERAPWTMSGVLAAGADDRGAPLRLADAITGTNDEEALEAPLVYPGATTVAVIADSLRRVVGVPLESFASRFTNAWTWQNFSILSSELPQPHPTILTHRDVRDRVDKFVPFFTQGRRVQPLLLGDSLYWAVDLYATSGDYPLSRHVEMMGETRSYVHHAGVAIVQGSTGDVSVVPDSVLDPIAQTWVQRLPSVFTSWTALPSGLREQLAPAIDGLYAQAAAFGQFGSRTGGEPQRRVPVLDGADTLLAGDDVPLALPVRGTTALVLPMIDDSDRLRGLLIGTGGANPLTAWAPLAAPGARWSAVIDRLRSIDSTGGGSREGPLAHGRIRTIPLRGGAAFVMPTYRWRAEGTPTLSRVAVLAGDSVRPIVPNAAILRAITGMPAIGPAPSLSALYQAMRDALRRGDWAAFGHAFDALGKAIERRTRP
ncbi:MAG TPA: UPF0182 family protein [Gemmatimonadaceae bacterium]|nr:UPF0182 family protein [Gemmatimonadaceae bacterium]